MLDGDSVTSLPFRDFFSFITFRWFGVQDECVDAEEALLGRYFLYGLIVTHLTAYIAHFLLVNK
jgi:hypothetical protein